MRIVPALFSSMIVCGLLAIRMATAADSPPAWAYTPNNPDYKPPVDDGKPVRVPDSTAGYTWSQLRDRFIAPVWHPSDHGALPDIVANGRKPGVFACGFCHRATGPGGPENADLAGLPKSYIIQQMADYKSGARGTALPGRTPPKLMIELSTLAERMRRMALTRVVLPTPGPPVMTSTCVSPSATADLWLSANTRPVRCSIQGIALSGSIHGQGSLPFPSCNSRSAMPRSALYRPARKTQGLSRRPCGSVVRQSNIPSAR